MYLYVIIDSNPETILNLCKHFLWQFPPEGQAPPGHNFHDSLIPFFPVDTHKDYLMRSTELGYDFDNMDETSLITTSDSVVSSMSAKESKSWKVLIVFGGISMLIAAGVTVHIRFGKKPDIKPKEEQPLLEDEEESSI